MSFIVRPSKSVALFQSKAKICRRGGSRRATKLNIITKIGVDSAECEVVLGA